MLVHLLSVSKMFDVVVTCVPGVSHSGAHTPVPWRSVGRVLPGPEGEEPVPGHALVPTLLPDLQGLLHYETGGTVRWAGL